MTLETGSRLGRYVVLAPLGSGGMGEVYRARDTELERDVAIKVLPEVMTGSQERLERFKREAKALAALNHPNIVTIFSVEEAEVSVTTGVVDTSCHPEPRRGEGSQEGLPATSPVGAALENGWDPSLAPRAQDDRGIETRRVRFFTMELVEGKTLAALTPEGGLPLKQFFELAVPLADALSAAHGRGVTHRDLKPTNVMVTGEGRVKVLDFGLAKRDDKPAVETDTTTDAVTGEGQVLGTVPYMSPEQLQGSDVDHRSDVFSLGVVLYEMLTGRRPFVGSSSADVISSILRDTPSSVTDVRADLPRHLGRIIRHCLEKDPERRYQAAKDIRNELEDLRREVESGEVGAVAIPPAPPAETTRAYRTPLVGRDEEHAELLRLLEQAQAGQGSLVMIGGEPGVGKTRLAWELYVNARERGFLSLIGHCYEMEGAPPLIPWVEILETIARVVPRVALRELLGDGGPEIARILPVLRRMFPDMPAALEMPPEDSRRFLFTCTRELIERTSRRQPHLLILEDLQWADTATLLLLQAVAPHLSTMAVMIVGTYRDVELDVARPLAEALRDLVRERLAHRLTLRRLSKEAVAGMLEGLAESEPPPPLVDAIFAETEGNPFFVEEVYQHLDEQGRLFDDGGRWRDDLAIDELDVPEGIRLVVGRRLEQLSEEGRGVLASAAVIGRSFGFDLLSDLAKIDPEALLDVVEHAERLRLITPGLDPGAREARYSFSHELIRQTLVTGLSMPRRQRVHLAIAEAIERTYPTDLEAHAADLAHHLFQAGATADPEMTVRYLILAGDRASEAGGFEDALRHYDNALSLVDEGDAETRAHVLSMRGSASGSFARYQDALPDWHEAIRLYDQLGDAVAAARARREAAKAIALQGRVEASVDVALRGVDALGNKPTYEGSRLLRLAGRMVSVGGDYQRGIELIKQARFMAEELDDRSLAAEALDYHAAACIDHMKAREAMELSRQAVEELSATGDLWALAEALGTNVYACLYLGRWDQIDEVAGDLEPLAVRVGSQLGLFDAQFTLGCREVALNGDLATFERFSMRSIEDFPGQQREWGYWCLGRTQLWTGSFPEALHTFQGGVTRKHDWYEPFFHGGEFLTRAHAGDHGAFHDLEQLSVDLPRPGEGGTVWRWVLLFDIVEGLALLGKRENTAALYPLVFEAIDTGTIVANVTLLQKYAGIAAAAGERWDDAEEHFETALQQAHEIPVRIEQPEVRRWYAWMLLDRDAPGDREKARTLLEEAIEAYREIGMPKHLEMAEALLADAKGRT